MLRFLLKFSLRSILRAAEASYNTPERKGARGERRVHNALTSVLDEKEYQVLSDLILPTAGGTTQLDHLVLSRFGIFVIETKNMSGWIFGSHDQKKWTQVQKGGSRRSFQNPLRQNYAHVKAVQEVLDVQVSSLHSIVVFTGSAEPKTDMPENVAWGLRDLGRLIALRRQPIFSDSQLNTFSERLQGEALESTRVNRKRHLQNLERNAATGGFRKLPAAQALPTRALCPKCGEEMVKRTNRKSGDTFLGCPRFPECRGTRKLA